MSGGLPITSDRFSTIHSHALAEFVSLTENALRFHCSFLSGEPKKTHRFLVVPLKPSPKFRFSRGFHSRQDPPRGIGWLESKSSATRITHKRRSRALSGRDLAQWVPTATRDLAQAVSRLQLFSSR